MTKFSSYPVILLVLLLLLLAPTLFGGGPAIYGAAVLIAIFSIMAYGLDVLVSDLGEVSLGHTIFFAAGAYVTALMSVRLDSNSWATLAASIGVSLILALAIGLFTLRLRDFAFSLVTYAVAVLAVTLTANWEFLGASDGIRGIPHIDLSIAGLVLTPKNDEELWPYAWTLLAVTIYMIYRFRRSTLGVAAVMVHENAKLARSQGIDVNRTRLAVFLFSAPITASAGWLYAYQRSFVSSDLLETYFLILMLIAVVMVGKRRILGPLLTVAAILIQEKFFSLGGNVDKIILGLLLVGVLGVVPQGIGEYIGDRFKERNGG